MAEAALKLVETKVNLDWRRRKKPQVPKNWNAEKSLENVRTTFLRWRDLNDKILNELWIAREKLRAPGKRTDLQPRKNFSEVKTWEQYCDRLGTTTQSVNGWLRRAFGSDEENFTQQFHISDEYRESVKAVLKIINLDTDNVEEPERLLGTHNGKSSQSKKWKGNVFLNLFNKNLNKPEKYIEKLFHRFESGRVEQAVVLVSPKCIGKDWFLPLYNGVICFTYHNLKLNDDREDNFGGCFVYFGNNKNGFIDEFRKIGILLEAVKLPKRKNDIKIERVVNRLLNV